MNHHITKEGIVPIDVSGQRFDQVVAQLFPEFSRARLQSWINAGDLTLNSRKVKPKIKVVGGERVQLSTLVEDPEDWLPQSMNINIVYEDDDILVINKPDNLVVHPAPGNYQGTLLNGLLHYLPNISHVPRAGIVHRLDKDTTGLMVIAKTLESQNHLVSQMQARSVSRHYVALLVGACPSQGLVDQAIGRDPKNRKKMAVVTGASGKEARTHFTLLAKLGPLSLVRLKLETGRTHQIRVHMSWLGYPIVGDQVYGKKISKQVQHELMDFTQADIEYVQNFSRQALHAQNLALVHPKTGEQSSWSAPFPEDMVALLKAVGGGGYV